MMRFDNLLRFAGFLHSSLRTESLRESSVDRSSDQFDPSAEEAEASVTRSSSDAFSGDSTFSTFADVPLDSVLLAVSEELFSASDDVSPEVSQGTPLYAGLTIL